MIGIARIRILVPGALALWLLVPGVAQGQIYSGSDASTGAVVLSNFRTEETGTLVDGTTPAVEPRAPQAAPAASAPTRVEASMPPTAEMRTLVDTAAMRNRLSPALVHAVILAESHYDPRAVSAKGAVGLMQLMPATGKRFGARDLFSAEQNVAAGASYLRWLMGQFDNHLDLVLAAYNAGEQAVINAGCRVPGYPETQAYVKGILEHLNRQAVAYKRSSAGTGIAGCA